MEETDAPLGKKRTFVMLVLLAGVLLVIGTAVFLQMPSRKSSQEIAAARNAVLEFGQRLKNVPLTGSEENVREAIQQNYTNYAATGVLAQWLEHPIEAPGRLTSSPWPDRIEIASITPQGSGYIVSGKIILMTSLEAASSSQGGQSAGEIPVVIQLIKEGDHWVIGAYQEQTSGS